MEIKINTCPVLGQQRVLGLQRDVVIISPFAVDSLSPPQRLLCIVGRLGRKKKRERAENDGKGEERREAPARFLFFRLLLFSKYPAGASTEERVLNLVNLMM